MARDELLDNPNALPFSKPMQNGALGHMLTNAQFFLLCKDRVQPHWFNHEAHNQVIWKGLVKFWDALKRTPNGREEFLGFDAIACLDSGERARVDTQYRVCTTDAGLFGLDVIKPRLQKWLQTHMFATFMRDGSNKFNKGELSAALDSIRQGMREVDTVKFSAETEVDFSRWEDVVKNAETEQANALTFGFDKLDKLMLPEAASGGLLKGDTTVLLAPTNVGKTTCLITIACANLMLGKDILFVVHEGRAQDLELKILRALGRWSNREFMEAYRTKDPAFSIKMSALQQVVKRHLTFLPLCKAGFAVEDLDSIIRRKHEERLQQEGKTYDCLVDDYPGILTTNKASKGNLAKRHIDDIVYGYFTQWALEFNLHSLVAIQGNREASRVNKGQKGDDRLLTIEDVSEAFGPMQTATNVITLNRDPNAMAKGFIIYNICKSRSNDTGWAVVCKSDYPRALTHSNRLGGYYYRGQSTPADRVDHFLEQYRNVDAPVPYHEIGMVAGA